MKSIRYVLLLLLVSASVEAASNEDYFGMDRLPDPRAETKEAAE